MKIAPMNTAIIIALLSCITVGCDYCGSTDDDAYEDDSSDYKGTGAGAAEGLFCIADTDGELRVAVRPAPRLTLDQMAIDVEDEPPGRIAEPALELNRTELDGQDANDPGEDVHFADLIEVDIDESPTAIGDLRPLD